MDELFQRLGVDRKKFEETVARDLESMPFAGSGSYRIEPLAGGASVRGYCRVFIEGQSPVDSMVVMILCDPDPARGVEEVMDAGFIRELPFINVHRHLSQCGINVPEIYHYNGDQGLIYMEDCGDLHLRSYAESSDVAAKKRAFEKALDELAKIQADASNCRSDDFLGFKVSFDKELLRWELDHFTQHAIKARMPGELSSRDEKVINSCFEAIVDDLFSSAYALQHRDYHLDNLIFSLGKVKVIDFQDALMGPLPYDLACFLYDRDTSALLGPALVEHLIGYYLRAFSERTGERVDEDDFRRVLDLCVIHRMLKVVGRFYFIEQVKMRPDFLRFIPCMLPVISEYLSKEERGRRLLEVVSRYFPGLA